MDKIIRFTVLISKSPNNAGYWAMVPALPGCFSAGDTFEAAQENVKEVIALHVHGMLKDGEEVPDDGGFIVAHADVDLEAKERSHTVIVKQRRLVLPEPEALYEIKEGIAYITLNRPEKLNAINPEMRQILWDAFQDVKHNPEVRCAIVTGRGWAFSTGHDLVAMANARANEGPSTGDLYVVQSSIWKPIIAAINGICLAQGCGLALGSDIRVASTEAQFGWPQVKRGISSVSGPALLAQVLPRNIAFEILFTGDFINAQRALELMLVNHVVSPEEVMPRAEEIARKITANAPLSIAAIKEASIMGAAMELEQRVAYAQLKRDVILHTEDAQEGVKAFAEKRAPVWKGR